MTQKELAIKIDVTPQTLTNWKKTKPELIRLLELAVKVEEEKSQNQKVINHGTIGSVNHGTVNGDIKIYTGNEMVHEICQELKKLNCKQLEKMYHLVKLEVLEGK